MLNCCRRPCPAFWIRVTRMGDGMSREPGKPSPKPMLHLDPPGRPRKQPRQLRSVALVDALKEACRDILEKEGHGALSLHRVSEQAGVAVSSIYEYFPTLESLIAAIFYDFRREA